ncbi:MAG: hypothetical protein Q8869_00120 [Candidatus Phytoplasma australasiaticum]|nr:hypothetical protein [Candidatus Phytoplasma australasiaticum]
MITLDKKAFEDNSNYKAVESFTFKVAIDKAAIREDLIIIIVDRAINAVIFIAKRITSL